MIREGALSTGVMGYGIWDMGYVDMGIWRNGEMEGEGIVGVVESSVLALVDGHVRFSECVGWRGVSF